MQNSSSNDPGEISKTDGCTDSTLLSGGTISDGKTGDGIQVRPKNNATMNIEKTNSAMKPVEAHVKNRVSLDKQSAVVPELEHYLVKDRSLKISEMPSGRDCNLSAKLNFNQSQGQVNQVDGVSKEVSKRQSTLSSEPLVNRSSSKNASEISACLFKPDAPTVQTIKDGKEEKVAECVVSSMSVSRDFTYNLPQQFKNNDCKASLKQDVSTGGITHKSLEGQSGADSKQNHTSKCTFGAPSSAACRRSNFLNEQSKPALSSSASLLLTRPSSHLPMNIVSERAKQFEHGIVRKGGIEVKSKSLDPPYSSNAVSSRSAVYERLSGGQKLTGTASYHETPESTVTEAKKTTQKQDNSNSTDDYTASPPECVWIRRASSERFDADMKNNLSHDAVDGKTCIQNSVALGTPAARACNLQKLKAFFGETTPRIMEAKAGSKSYLEEHGGDGVTDAVSLESKKDCTSKCDTAIAAQQKSLTFDPASWALERMARGKKAAAWSLASRSHSSHSPGAGGRPKKSTERDPSSSPKQKEHKTWKGKMAETFKRYGSGPAVPGGECSQSEEVLGTFGVPLELLPPSLVNEFVPSFVEMCTRVVDEKGLQNQGIYRVPGNSGALNAMIDELNKDPHGLFMESEKWLDLNLVSSMLKLFFRKLPDPLITDELYEAVIAANRTDNSEKRMLKLKKLIHDLPEHNFETLRFLAQHLNKVSSHEDVNKMDAHNLAIVFGPTLVRPQDDTMVVMVRDMADQCRVVESIIIHCDWFFSSWDEDVYVPVDEEAEDATPISGMNKELLAKAERLAFPRLPRDSRCKEIVSSFIQAANRKIRGRRESLEPSSNLTADEDCPAKKFKKSIQKDEGRRLNRYLSESIMRRHKIRTVRNVQSHSTLQEALLNRTGHFVCHKGLQRRPCGIENMQTKFYTASHDSSLDPVLSQESCRTLQVEQRVWHDFEVETKMDDFDMSNPSLGFVSIVDLDTEKL